MKITRLGLQVLLCLALFLTLELNIFKVHEVDALDTNVVEFMDIEVPALDGWGGFDENDGTWWMAAPYMALSDFSLHVKREAYTITKIRYNKVTQMMSYEISPNAPQYDITVTRSFARLEASSLKQGSHWVEYDIRYQHAPHFYGPNPYGEEQRDQLSYYGDMFYVDYYHPGQTGGVVPVDGPNFYYGQYNGASNITSGSFYVGQTSPTDYFGITGIPKYLEFNDEISGMMGVNLSMQKKFFLSDYHKWALIQNSAPTLSLISPNNATIQNEEGYNILNVEGYAQDPDNDDLNIVVEVPNVYYRKEKVSNTLTPHYFSIPIDAIADSLSPGTYPVKVSVVDPYNKKAEGSLTFNVVVRLKNKSFVLVDDPVHLDNTYTDFENDPQYAKRYRYEHDPYFFDNSMGIISDSGLWRSALYTSFPYSGLYSVYFQLKDNPKNDNRFDKYRIWGPDNISSMVFNVHRKPIALFTAKLVNGSLQLSDSSYDLDHTTSPTKGISAWQWQYKKTGSEVWTEGVPPAQLPTSDQYDIRLRVRDVDGENKIGVWSDWCLRIAGSAINLPPVAMFTVDPSIVSYRKATTITDQSFDPDNDSLDIYSWALVKNGSQQVWSSYGGAVIPPNIAAYGEGSYVITLQVHDNRGLWSTPYSQTVQVINHPPAASFNMPSEVYRDTVITMDNQTPDPDEDGDSLSYAWNAQLDGGAYYYSGSNRYPVMKVTDLIQRSGITPKAAVSAGWEMRLNASDGVLSSNAMHTFTVLNHIPAAAINGPSEAARYNTVSYNSADADEDPSDVSSLRYYWRVTDSEGLIHFYNTQNIRMNFNEVGVYTLEHWAVDQIDAKSNVAVMKVNVTPNLAPSLTLTTPAGTPGDPSVLDAELQGDPLIQWTYSDPDSDPQEKYRLEFFSTSGVLVNTVENPDSTGLLRQYQVPNRTFERFEIFTLYGRAYSTNSWSDVSNEKAFIIDNPPQPGFTLITDTGRNAAQVPIYRTDILQIKSTATDADIPKGDGIAHQYFLKPSSGAESLAGTRSTFTKQFSTNGAFTLRQVVTDSLGLYRELSQTITVVNRIPTVNLTYPASTSQAVPTIASTLTPVIKWEYQDEDGDLQQRYKVRIINLTTGAAAVQSGEQASSAKQWQIPAGMLAENQKYAVEVEVFDGFSWSALSPRKYFMVNLLTVKGGVQHTAEWNANRQAYNLNKSGNAETPRGYSVFWAGEGFVLQADATGLPDTVEAVMTGGYATQLSPKDSSKTLWTGELYNTAFEKLPEGPLTFTFTAKNEYNTKIDRVTVTILGDWTEYFQSHRVK
ncbi:hypothetical protein [Paenibacillus sp. S150]|uniref:hypothetical protein n=1 Tax=Paenibacillus sp. S150 TaxID=2749826 RepID=UPI001C55DED9|nr:hypothetical protein [Paenibacillus sp. S150]MBW4083454.1 hypothetical protein [Paenibacillus sp. S150]